MKRADKIQEWLADRVSFIQYPNIRAADASTRQTSRSGLRFKYQMPLGKRIDLFLISTVLLLIGLAALFGVCFFIYAVLF